MKTFIQISLLVLTMTAVAACGRLKTVTTSFYNDKAIQVELIHEVGPGGIIAKKAFQHPMNVRTEDMTVALKSLRYSDPVFMWKEKDRPIFSDQEVEVLAPHLTQALATANADQMIRFALKTWKKDLIFGSDKYTDGLLFLQNNQINWAFGNVNFTDSGQYGEKFNGDPMSSVPKGVRLTEENGLAYFHAPSARWYEPSVFPNWLVGPTPFAAASAEVVAETPAAPEIKPAPPAKAVVAAPSAPVAKAAPAPTHDKASERLRRLKTLLDEKLISEEDYNQKKKEILRDL